MTSDEDALLEWRTRTTFVNGPERRGFARGLGFSQTEMFQLLVAVLVLTLAFTIAFAVHAHGTITGVGSVTIAGLALAFVAVSTAFVLHELGHKFAAQRYGCWAEFRWWPLGLGIAFFTSLLGMLFAAPGAVNIRGSLTRRQLGWTAAAGPFTNMGLAILFIGLMVARLEWDVGMKIDGVSMLALINVALAGFNLIPFDPLDGRKIWRWSPYAYLSMVGMVVGLAVLWMVA